MLNYKNLDLMQIGFRINFPGGGGWGCGWLGVAGYTENKANPANPAELELELSWAELGKIKECIPNFMIQLVSV